MVIENVIRNNKGGAGVWVRANSGAGITDNVIEGHEIGIGVVESGHADIAANTIASNGSGVVVERNASVIFPPWNDANLIEGNSWYGVRCGKSGSLEVSIPQDYGTGNTPADELIDPGCDKTGF